MQNLNIKQPTEQLNQVKAFAILINCPTVATAAVAILSSYLVPTVPTDCSVSTVLDLYCCQVYTV